MLGSVRTAVSFSSIGQTLRQPPHQTVPLGELGGWGATSGGYREAITAEFEDVVENAYKANGIFFACVQARALPFAQARFQYQELVNGRPGRLRGDASLSILEVPWPNATTGELLWRMEQDASLAGNCYLTQVGPLGRRRIRRLRPDWMTIITGVPDDDAASPFALEAEVLGYIYHPRGVTNGPPPRLLTPDQVVHYSPIPDPVAQWRGMSWVQPVLSEISADSQATEHKAKFFEHGAASNMVVAYDASVDPDKVRRFAEIFAQQHEGTRNAYKTIHLGGGADAKTLGADLRQLDFKATQGAGETRIAAAAGVGAIIARFSEGLQGSSLNAGNYQAAKRQFADMTLRPLWSSAAAALSKFTSPLPGSRLWYDDRDIEFLKDDRKDQTEILQQQAGTIRQLIDAGYEPDAVIDAVEAGDLSRLTGRHSGLYSVQLQAPGSPAKASSKQATTDQLALPV